MTYSEARTALMQHPVEDLITYILSSNFFHSAESISNQIRRLTLNRKLTESQQRVKQLTDESHRLLHAPAAKFGKSIMAQQKFLNYQHRIDVEWAKQKELEKELYGD